MADDFITIGLTLPGPFPCGEKVEAGIIEDFIGSGAIDIFHIRKPDCTIEYTHNLLDFIHPAFHSRLSIHSPVKLFPSYRFGGIHVKSKAELAIASGSDCRTSRSCHSVEELANDSSYDFDYSFLSPIFDSVSKENYGSRFSLSDPELLKVIGVNRVVALGGVKPEFFKNLFEAKFVGAALLGYLWDPKLSLSQRIASILEAKKTYSKRNLNQ